MATEKKTFEQELQELETIVSSLERGDVPLEEALAQFQTGVQLAGKLNGTLKNAEEAVTKVMTPDGELKPFEDNDDKQSAE
ncbi:exodeoxyribonuclease VII small subunit [Lacticaseibacillus songhuajiangensis]|jgi:exodeoxyribonuclease VII small subunit|uniref:exodeoxyribonuclease VII small subunit n=1 Tax=Lacticaseibacillus songhuajiangensis TaxID=1296539 RepID=UPI000F7A8570|nr:exodeoxyribonuclease VII small subunit [Lacticaseibacillus songhuajiangensis]MCI1283801.1 exodeoxyribonuclease VII small subunit [Lacticaseibacillus songhuajiangensis]